MIQLQDLFVKASDYRPFQSNVLNKVSGNCSRWMIHYLANAILPSFFRKSSGVEQYLKTKAEGRVSKAVICMTSFPQRIDTVWLVVECLLRQTRIPNKIVIYLSNIQFNSANKLPESLKVYPKDLVEVIFVNDDIRSHKKYWYAVKEYFDRPIILVDDDLIYDSHVVEDLEKTTQKNSNTIACCWGHKMRWNDTGEIMPYSKWGGVQPLYSVNSDYFFGSGGGTYFPVGSLEGANIPTKEIMTICPYADDIWLNAITRINGYRTCRIRNYNSVPEWKIVNNKKLHSINNGSHNYNDKQLVQVREYFINKYGRDPFIKDFLGK